jgi:hypothetical protein
MVLKVTFKLPKLRIKCSYKEGVIENVMSGIHLRGVRVQPPEQTGHLISQLDITMGCGEIMV